MTTTTTPPAVQRPLTGTAAARAVRKAFSGSLASVLVIEIGVMWTIPTFGLFITSFRSKEDAATTGWWVVLLHPSYNLSGYDHVLTSQWGLISPLLNSQAITIPATIIPFFVASMA